MAKSPFSKDIKFVTAKGKRYAYFKTGEYAGGKQILRAQDRDAGAVSRTAARYGQVSWENRFPYSMGGGVMADKPSCASCRYCFGQRLLLLSAATKTRA